MADSFQADCDQCGCQFDSDDPVWDDYEEYNDTYDKLMLVLNPCGYHPSWFCSKSCQIDAIEAVRKEIIATYETTNCCKCDAKIGENRIKPCHECENLVCAQCAVEDDSVGYFCSEQCKNAKKRCKNCYMRIPKSDPDYCDYCKKLSTNK